MDTPAEIVKALVLELKPGHNYIIGLDSHKVRKTDAAALGGLLNEQGFGDCTIMMFNGDPTTGMVALEKKDDGSTSAI